jgi:hypothetical protein
LERLDTAITTATSLYDYIRFSEKADKILAGEEGYFESPLLSETEALINYLYELRNEFQTISEKSDRELRVHISRTDLSGTE